MGSCCSSGGAVPDVFIPLLNPDEIPSDRRSSNDRGCLQLDFNTHFNDVYKCVEDVRANSSLLATYLGVDRREVEAIESSESDPGNRLSKVLSSWLKRSSKTQSTPPSWRSLCDAIAGMGETSLAEKIKREHPCSCGLCAGSKATPIQVDGSQDTKSATAKLKELFDDLMVLLHGRIRQLNPDNIRYHISQYFIGESSGHEVDDKIEKYLAKSEHYDTPNAILNYFLRCRFIGYINYSLVKVFQKQAENSSLDEHIEEYEKNYQCFLKVSLTRLHDGFQQCPDLRPDYPAGLPQFDLHLNSEWEGKSIFELKEFLKQCSDKSDCIDQVMIADVRRKCIIVTFAVLPHIAQAVLQYLTNDVVISTLQKEGIAVNISEELIEYQQKTTEEIVAMTVSFLTMPETPVQSKVKRLRSLTGFSYEEGGHGIVPKRHSE